MSLWLIWLIAAAALIIVEVCSQMMWALCLAIGAIAAMTASIFDASLITQVIILAAASIITYIILLPWLTRRQDTKSHKTARTGMDALLGRTAIVTNEIKPGELGRARIDGDNWQVRAPGVDHIIPRGQQVSVTAYDSIILTVEPSINPKQ